MGDKRTVRVVVVEHHELMRTSLVIALEAEVDLEVVGEAPDGAGALSEVRRTLPDVVVLEVPTSPIGAPLAADHYAGVEFPRHLWVELFTDSARRVVVLAQEEARLLNHNHIGAEHILLGLLHDSEGVAAKALESLGISLEKVRQQVVEIIGAGQLPPSDHIPFTPRARNVLEQSLSEALQLGHHCIDTEHLMLGLIREGEGVATQALVKLGADLGRVREEFIQLLSGVPGATERDQRISVLRELRDAFPSLGIVARLSDELAPNLVAVALEAGATSYLSIAEPLEKLVFAVRVAANLNRPET